MSLVYYRRKAKMRAARALDRTLGAVAVGGLKAMRLVDHKRMARVTGAVTRALGPLMKEQRIARAQLVAAFPEKSMAEIDAILTGVWDNLGRVAAEFSQIDRIKTRDPDDATLPYEIDYSDDTLTRFRGLRDDAKPGLLFTAHLANWELSAQVAQTYGLDNVVLYRRPNMAAVADAILALRRGSMGTLMPTGFEAPLKLAQALQAGRHVAMLVDQHYVRGVDVVFFGRRVKANPLIARLARQVECPIHGARMVRLPGGGFRCDVTPEVEPARDAEGKIDVQGTMQAITNVVEGWVREHPEQWLWVHRRWRDE